MPVGPAPVGSAPAAGLRLAVWDAPPARALADALAASGLVGAVVVVEPAAARAALDGGTADLALLPTLDVLRAPEGLAVVPGVALAGEKSPRVTLVVGSALDAIETVAFGPQDAQEALLVQLVLREHYDGHPSFRLVAGDETPEVLLERSDAALVAVDTPLPEGTFELDPGQEWTDLTLRPMPWGLVAAAEGVLDAAAFDALAAAVRAFDAGDLRLRRDGVAAFQLTLDGYATDGLEQLVGYWFQTGTLAEVPDVPFVAPPAEPPADPALN